MSKNGTTEPPVAAATTTASPGSGGGDDNTAIIITLVVVFGVLIIVAVGLRIWFYRRKTGHWPHLCKRCQRPPPAHLRPFGDKSATTRWQNNNNNNAPGPVRQITSHRADYRLPSPKDHVKRVTTVAETVANSASPKRVQQPKEAASAKVSCKVKNPSEKSPQHEAKSVRNSVRSSKRSQKLPSDIGFYDDRTLPATLMMSDESKKQKFSHANSDLKRSNSATLRKPINGKSGLQRPRPYSVNIEVYNDFSGERAIGRFQKQQHLAVAPSQLSSKPSNTSDYVSDVEAAEGRHWRKRKNASRLRTTDRRKRASDCDSAFQDCPFIENEGILEVYESEMGEAPERDFETMQALRLHLDSDSVFANVDDRTESQQNTMRPEALEIALRIGSIGGSNDTLENQSSDTESMADSCITAKGGGSLRMRQYDSDGGPRPSRTSRAGIKTRNRRRPKSTVPSGWESESGVDTKRRTNVAKRRSKSRDRKPLPADRKTAKISSKPEDNTPTRRRSPAKKRYHTTSLTTPVSGGTVIEMPIYSQATWAGPGSVVGRSANARRQHPPKTRHQSENSSGVPATARPQSARTRPRHPKASRKWSIGGGGRYICEYGTLPVDLSRLPADLLEKIGGQPDRLLEPLDQLNFDKLCRPLPTLGEGEAKLSARRLVSEKLCLPPGHRDREMLSNTYELEATGLVMTDL